MSVVLWPVFMLRRTLLTYSHLKDYSLKNFKNGEICSINLSSYLQKFLKTQSSIPTGYFLLFSEGYGDFDGLYRDARYGFTLVKRRLFRTVPLALITFDVSDTDASVVIVRQLQGVRNRQRYLKDLKWERMFVEIVTEWAQGQGFQRIEIIQAKQSTWYSSTRAEQMRMRYDTTARRMGFKFNKESERYVKDIA